MAFRGSEPTEKREKGDKIPDGDLNSNVNRGDQRRAARAERGGTRGGRGRGGRAEAFDLHKPADDVDDGDGFQVVRNEKRGKGKFANANDSDSGDEKPKHQPRGGRFGMGF